MELAVGIALVLLGAASASATARELDERGRSVLIPVAVAPMGVLIGAGGAIARGWSLVPTALAGAVALPLIVLASRLVEARRRSRQSR